ncbi:MAG: DEAD/DEAH box helicase family protein, partial [DPANN group archaeon]|nr:DEAD/DEAH box helicase family protein [DPANN group archaeon]
MTEFIKHPLIKDNTIELRRYQESIIAGCSKKNSLVVLPTGIGKTIIGVGIAAHRLHIDKGSKVLIMAPTKPLVEQHLKSFESVMKPEIIGKFTILTGAVSPKDRGVIYNENHVIFATPQVIQNDIFKGLLNLNVFNLIVFDEAHRASGNYAYTFIAKKYMESAKKPLILGLTASPGGTKEQVGRICSNLFIDNIEVKSETDWDVKDYVMETSIDWLKLDCPKEFDLIRTYINNYIATIVKFLSSKGLISTTQPKKREILELQKNIGSRLAYDKDPMLFEAISQASALIKISHALELLESQGVPQTYAYLKRLFSDTTTKATKLIIANKDIQNAFDLIEKLYISDFEHPKLDVLKNLLEEHVVSGKKAMVFAQYVHTIDLIIEKINSAGNKDL